MGWFVAGLVGISVVLQGGTNRLVSQQWGLPKAVLFNSSVFLVLSLAWFGAAKLSPSSFPELFRIKQGGINAWFILPGVFGFIIVAGIPYAISRIGASQTFILSIAAQLIFSLIWDKHMEGLTISSLKMVALAAVFVSVTFFLQVK